MTSAPIFNNSNIQSLLEEDVKACNALLQLLEQERSALKERNHEQLEAIIHTKAHHLQHLENSAKIRSEWAHLYQSSEQNPEEKWRSIMDEQAPTTVKLWQELKQLLQQCRQENEVNGKILSRNQKTFSRLMSILRGQTGSTSLYTNKGGKNAHIPGQRIGEA